MELRHFMRCPKGVKDLLNLPRILQWLSDAQGAVVSPRALKTLGLPHDCDTTAAADTFAQLLQRLPHPDDAAATAATSDDRVKQRLAVITAAKVGGGSVAWQFRGVGSDETCLLQPPSQLSVYITCRREETESGSLLPSPMSELGLTLRALLASNSTPGVSEPVRVWGPQGGFHGTDGGAFVDGRLVANLSIGEAVGACQQELRRHGHSETEVKGGRGVVLDVIGTVPFEEPEVEQQLLQITEQLGITKASKRQKQNKMPTSLLLKDVKRVYPFVTIRHVLFPEENFYLLSDYGDYRSSMALLHHGRVLGWKATTLDDLE